MSFTNEVEKTGKGLSSRFLVKMLLVIIPVFWSRIFPSYSQAQHTHDSIQYFTLEQCIVYALEHQPSVIQAGLGIEIAHKTNTINLSTWLPQVGVNGTFTHYYQLPTSFVTNPGGPNLKENVGIVNTLLPQLAI